MDITMLCSYLKAINKNAILLICMNFTSKEQIRNLYEKRDKMIFILLYIVLYPVVLIIAKIYMAQNGASSSLGDYLVLPFWWAFLWTFVPAILLSIGIDVYRKGKLEESKDLKTGDHIQTEAKEKSDEKEKP